MINYTTMLEGAAGCIGVLEEKDRKRAVRTLVDRFGVAPGKRGRKPVARDAVVELLAKRPLTTERVAEKLGIGLVAATARLRRLLEEKVVSYGPPAGPDGDWIWCLTGGGR